MLILSAATYLEVPYLRQLGGILPDLSTSRLESGVAFQRLSAPTAIVGTAHSKMIERSKPKLL